MIGRQLFVRGGFPSPYHRITTGLRSQGITALPDSCPTSSLVLFCPTMSQAIYSQDSPPPNRESLAVQFPCSWQGCLCIPSCWRSQGPAVKTDRGPYLSCPFIIVCLWSRAGRACDWTHPNCLLKSRTTSSSLSCDIQSPIYIVMRRVSMCHSIYLRVSLIRAPLHTVDIARKCVGQVVALFPGRLSLPS